MAGVISSVRYAGPPNDYRTDSLTIYQHDYFQGKEEFFSKDMGNLMQFYGNNQSVIVTGKSDWTVFDQPNYQGNGICLQVPDPYSFKFTPSFIENFQKSTADSINYGSIQSVLKGCQGQMNLTMSSF